MKETEQASKRHRKTGTQKIDGHMQRERETEREIKTQVTQTDRKTDTSHETWQCPPKSQITFNGDEKRDVLQEYQIYLHSPLPPFSSFAWTIFCPGASLKAWIGEDEIAPAPSLPDNCTYYVREESVSTDDLKTLKPGRYIHDKVFYHSVLFCNCRQFVQRQELMVSCPSTAIWLSSSLL